MKLIRENVHCPSRSKKDWGLLVSSQEGKPTTVLGFHMLMSGTETCVLSSVELERDMRGWEEGWRNISSQEALERYPCNSKGARGSLFWEADDRGHIVDRLIEGRWRTRNRSKTGSSARGPLVSGFVLSVSYEPDLGFEQRLKAIS